MQDRKINKVSIQGVRGAFHEIAAREYFRDEEIDIYECNTFKDVVSSVKSGISGFGIMAIENSIAGSILPNYSLLEAYGFKVVGELYLRIEMSLMALAGQRLEDLRTIQSHPMALLQCDEYLSNHAYLKVVEGSDTAESAKDIRDKKLVGWGAIASASAAQEYGLEILAAGIETNKQNYTRFLVLCRSGDYQASPLANKASIRFEVAHRPGSLARVLDHFSELGLNMTKIQSVPILGRPYEYSFHVDLEWSEIQKYEQALEVTAPHVVNLIQFGTYVKSERPSV